MRFEDTALDGVVLVHTDRHVDDRGWFARSWCAREFREHGLPPLDVQANLSFNEVRHTLRGMHWQSAPSTEAKLVRPVTGAIWDVVVDARPDSPGLGRHLAVELDSAQATALFVPAGFAHGFLTLQDATLVHYHMGAEYDPGLARGFRWDDPEVDIGWPHEPTVISDRDRALPSLREAVAGLR